MASSWAIKSRSSCRSKLVEKLPGLTSFQTWRTRRLAIGSNRTILLLLRLPVVVVVACSCS